jgi:hypothetical protein
LETIPVPDAIAVGETKVKVAATAAGVIFNIMTCPCLAAISVGKPTLRLEILLLRQETAVTGAIASRESPG